MTQHAEFTLCDGTLASCSISDGGVPETGAVCLVEIDGLREFGRFIRVCAEHAPCHGYALGNFISARYSMRIGMNRMILAGAVICCSPCRGT